MSQEDVKQLKISLMQARQQISQYQQQNNDLRTKCSEWYEWSQKIQQTLQEKENTINTLKNQLTRFEQEKKEREESIGHRTVEDLYEENQNLEIHLREYKHYTNEMAKLLYEFLVQKNLSSQETEKIATILSKCRIDEIHIAIFAFLLKERGAIDVSTIAKSLNIAVSDVNRNIKTLTNNDLIKKIDSTTFTAERDVIQANNYETANIDEILRSTQLRIDNAKTIDQACDILEDFSTAVNQRNYTLIASDIGRKSAEIRRNKYKYQIKDVAEQFLRWKKELTPDQQKTPQIQQELTPEFLASLPNMDIIDEVKTAMNDARSTDILLEIISTFNEALKLKGGQGMLIMKIRNFLNENKESKLLNKSICLDKLDEWEQKLIR